MTDFPYDDIVNLPHYVSATRKRLSPESRAAQFAPFAALTGHSAAISETARLNEARIEALAHPSDDDDENISPVAGLEDLL